jgi:hypothetical protein
MLLGSQSLPNHVQQILRVDAKTHIVDGGRTPRSTLDNAMLMCIFCVSSPVLPALHGHAPAPHTTPSIELLSAAIPYIPAAALKMRLAHVSKNKRFRNRRSFVAPTTTVCGNPPCLRMIRSSSQGGQSDLLKLCLRPGSLKLGGGRTIELISSKFSGTSIRLALG